MLGAHKVKHHATCLISHKCRPGSGSPPCLVEASEFGTLLANSLESEAISFLCDPFGPGVRIESLIETLEFHALLFLSCAKSDASHWCRMELRTAEQRGIAIFVVLVDDHVPKRLLERIAINAVEYDKDPHGLPTCSTELEDQLRLLASEIGLHAKTWKEIQRLREGIYPDEKRSVAQDLAGHPSPHVLHNFLSSLEAAYTPKLDPVARYYLALALGRCGNRARKILLRLQKGEGDDFPRAGIAEALNIMATESP